MKKIIKFFIVAILFGIMFTSKIDALKDNKDINIDIKINRDNNEITLNLDLTKTNEKVNTYIIVIEYDKASLSFNSDNSYINDNYINAISTENGRIIMLNVDNLNNHTIANLKFTQNDNTKKANFKISCEYELLNKYIGNIKEEKEI